MQKIFSFILSFCLFPAGVFAQQETRNWQEDIPYKVFQRGIHSIRTLPEPATTLNPAGRTIKNEQKARITLDVQMDWGDGSGYQILLDSNHNAYGNIIPEDRFLPVLGNGNLPDDFYDVFEYTIPENANGNLNDGYWVSAPDRVTIDIEPGVYDYCVINPSPGQIVYVASGEDAVGNDIAFQAGLEYVFTIQRNGNYDICTREVVAPVEMGILDILLPEDGWNLGEESVRVKLVNRGTEDIASFQIRLHVDDQAPLQETADMVILAGDTAEYTLQKKADLSAAGRHTLKVAVVAEYDADPRNDSIEKMVYHIEAKPTPYECNFDQPGDFDRWNTLDSNADGKTWEWAQGRDANGNSKGGYVLVNFSPKGIETDDYLVTKDPVILKAGKNHIAFKYTAYSSSYQESLEVFYGTENDIRQMEKLWEDTLFSADQDHWLFESVEFSLAEENEYYFAFHGFSKPEQWAVLLDNIVVDTGSYIGEPDICVNQVVLPLSDCSLAQERIGANLSNKGTQDISRFSLSYQIGNGPVVFQEFTDSLPSGGEITVYFDQEADFSEPDSTYQVAVSAEIIPADGQTEESVLFNNRAERAISHFSPHELPFHTLFSDSSQRTAWTSEERAWLYDASTEAIANQSSKPLASQCINLEEGSEYSISLRFKAGTLMWDVFQATENFKLIYGLSGTDMENWDSLFHFKEAYTDEEFVTESKDFFAPGSGEYSFAIVPVTTNYTIRIQDISIVKIQDYDIAINAFDAGLARMVPAVQVNTKFMTSTVVQNKGLYPVDSVRVVISHSGTPLMESRVAMGFMGEPDSSLSIELPVSMNGLKAGDSLVLTVEASIIGHENQDYTDDNSMHLCTLLTDSIMGYDKATAESYLSGLGIGARTPLNLGLVYHLNASDTLTGFAIGWAEGDDQAVGIAVYRWIPEENRMGECLFSDTVDRGVQAGERAYLIPALYLENGDYMFEAQQLSQINFAMISDFSPEGYFYVTSNSPLSIQRNLGFPVFRAIFGKATSAPASNTKEIPQSERSISIYPNPAKETVHIQLDEGNLSEILVFNRQGQLLRRWSGNGKLAILNIIDLQSGVYIIKAQSDEGIFHGKFVKL